MVLGYRCSFENNSCPSGNSGCDTSCFRIGKEKFLTRPFGRPLRGACAVQLALLVVVLARKSRDCEEAYYRTPHKQSRRLTPPGRKRALSRRKLIQALPVFSHLR